MVKHVKFQMVKFLAGLFYISGLTSLIPIVPLAFSPSSFAVLQYAFTIALFFIFLSFIFIYFFTSSKKKAFRELGFITLIPGLLAVFFSYAGPRRIALFIGLFQKLSPYVQEVLNGYVPKTWLLSGIYIIVGVSFIWLSEKVSH